MSLEGLYSEVYGLHERPFTLLPDPDFIFWSNAHRSAYTVLEYGIISRAPITVVTGEVGAGKTTLIHALIQSMEDDTTIGLISNAQGGRGDLLRWALNALAINVNEALDYVALFQVLQDFLLEEYAAGRRVVLIIDEAQNLSFEALEELRMMTNINSNKDELLQLVLVGQPELRDLIRQPELRQFAQRVVASYHIPKMDRDTVQMYIEHRLRHAGGTGEEFSEASIEPIAAASEGIPRLVNRICDFAMVYAASNNENQVTRETIQNVMNEGIFIATKDSEADT